MVSSVGYLVIEAYLLAFSLVFLKKDCHSKVLVPFTFVGCGGTCYVCAWSLTSWEKLCCQKTEKSLVGNFVS